MAATPGSFAATYLVAGKNDDTPIGSFLDGVPVDVIPYYWDSILLEYVVATTAGAGVGTEVKVTNTVVVSAASLPLPAGASTGAKQDTGNASLASIDGKLPAGGLATSGKQDTGNASLASIDGKLTNPLPVSAAVLPLPAGASTEAGLTDILNELALKTEPADQQHTIIDEMPPVSANTAADVLTIDGDAGYTAGDLAKSISQTPDGRLRVAIAGLVEDAMPSLSDGVLQTLSMTNDGRLRVATLPARVEVPFFSADQERAWGTLEPVYTFNGSPWGNW